MFNIERLIQGVACRIFKGGFYRNKSYETVYLKLSKRCFFGTCIFSHCHIVSDVPLLINGCIVNRKLPKKYPHYFRIIPKLPDYYACISNSILTDCIIDAPIYLDMTLIKRHNIPVSAWEKNRCVKFDDVKDE